MGQVPNKSASYLIIGRGKLSRHLQHYFNLLNINYCVWHRDLPQTVLNEYFKKSDVVLLAISDSAIHSFVNEHIYLKEKPLVHFSGAHEFESIIGFHPMMTFAQDFYPLADYQRILFVTTNLDVKFSELFPQLKNKSIMLQPTQKAFYHALCVMTSNFPNILWGSTIKEFQNMGIQKEYFDVYVQKTVDNFISNPKASLTGPLSRGDFATVEKNKKSLSQSSLRDLYIAFENFYKTYKM